MIDAKTASEVIDSFLRQRPASAHSNGARTIVQQDQGLYSGERRLALWLNPQEVWVTNAPLPHGLALHRGMVKLAAMVAGFTVREGVEPPALPSGDFATIPPVSAEDALLVVEALTRHADRCNDAEVAARARALAEVYRAAATGARALAGGLYQALQSTRSPEE